MRTLTTFGIAAVAATAASFALAPPVEGASRNFTAGNFDRVRAAGPFDVAIRVGPAASVHADGPQRALDHIIVETNGGELVIRPDRSADWRDWRSWFAHDEKMLVTVTVPMLRGVSLAGSGDVNVDHARAPAFHGGIAGSGDLTIGSIQADAVSLSIAGSGDLRVAGRAGRVEAKVAGSGDIDGNGLVAQDAQVNVAGSGDVALTANRTANVSLVGSGDITITGGARCTVSKHGSGDISCGR